jgi:uroporphyrinogen-III decarboxylase
MICERILEFQERWPQAAIGISDNQSPINVLTFILHSEAAMIAMYEEKKIIHRIMEVVTDSIIEYNRHLERIIKNFKGFTTQHFTHLPKGMQVSDDNAAFLSPSLYAEFARPYGEKLAKEFGGLNHHCCMGYEQNLKTIAEEEGFLGFDPHVDYNSIDKILDAVEGKGVWIVNNFPGQKRDTRTETDEETFIRAIDRSEGRCSLAMVVRGKTREEAMRLGYFVKEYAAKKGRLA